MPSLGENGHVRVPRWARTTAKVKLRSRASATPPPTTSHQGPLRAFVTMRMAIRAVEIMMKIIFEDKSIYEKNNHRCHTLISIGKFEEEKTCFICILDSVVPAAAAQKQIIQTTTLSTS